VGKVNIEEGTIEGLTITKEIDTGDERDPMVIQITSPGPVNVDNLETETLDGGDPDFEEICGLSPACMEDVTMEVDYQDVEKLNLPDTVIKTCFKEECENLESTGSSDKGTLEDTMELMDENPANLEEIVDGLDDDEDKLDETEELLQDVDEPLDKMQEEEQKENIEDNVEKIEDIIYEEDEDDEEKEKEEEDDEEKEEEKDKEDGDDEEEEKEDDEEKEKSDDKEEAADQDEVELLNETISKL